METPGFGFLSVCLQHFIPLLWSEAEWRPSGETERSQSILLWPVLEEKGTKKVEVIALLLFSQVLGQGGVS